MVLSHALITPRKELVRVSSLLHLFDHLITDANSEGEISTLELDAPRTAAKAISRDLLEAAEALIVRPPEPVVRLGPEGFEGLVADLWAQLWPEVRENFAFRLSFGPGDLVETPQPLLICTPKELVARWSKHRVLSGPPSAPSSLAVAMLCGLDDGEPLRRFAGQIDARLTSLTDLPLLEQAYRLTALAPDTFGNTLASMRLIDRLSISTGGTAKPKLIDRLLSHLETASASDVLQLRNLSIGNFPDSSRIWADLSRWMENHSFPPTQDEQLISLIFHALHRAEAIAEWSDAVAAGLTLAAHQPRQALPSALWRWAESNREVIGLVLREICGVDGLEARLVGAAPKQTKNEIAEAFIAFAKRNAWFRLHGAAVSATYCPLEAVARQVAVEVPSTAEGVKLALRNADPAQVLDCALKVQDPWLVQFGSQAVANNPTLLSKVDMSTDAARLIWSGALTAKPSAWQGPAAPVRIFHQILDDWLDGKLNVPGLVDQLSLTPLANVIDFYRRAELWAKLPNPSVDRMLRTTALGWIEAASTWLNGGSSTPPAAALESTLQSAVLRQPEFKRMMDELATHDVARSVEVLSAVSELDELTFRHWLGALIPRATILSVADAEHIGRLIAERNWRQAASDLLKAFSSGRRDVKPALRNCVSLIGFLDRWYYDLTPISAQEKWDSLEELAAELYPTGPDHSDLWERADGKDADLPSAGSGRSRWRESLARIRRGGRGPRISVLLTQMQGDYPLNRSLRFLAEDVEFGGPRY
jgi:hypothetical protein